MDPRIAKLARTLVTWSLKVGERERIVVYSNPAAEALSVAVYEELLRAGAFPAVILQPERCAELLLTRGKAHQLDELNPWEAAGLKAADGTLRILASGNTRALSGVNPKKQARLAHTGRKRSNIVLKKKWSLTLFPTPAYAEDAEMSLSEFDDFVYGASFSDEDRPVAAWRALFRKQENLVGKLEGAREVHIVGPDTDLRFSVEGRTFINSPGTNNMPSGEVFTGPVEDSAEGHIAYDYPVVNGGREIDGIRLVFRKGRVVEATATKNEAYLKAMLDLDPGARRLGELGIGTNFKIRRFIKNILFDEKIGGTVHLALGNSYPATGGVNKSALHWDMIKDLRKGGALYVDGKKVQENGAFVRGWF